MTRMMNTAASAALLATALFASACNGAETVDDQSLSATGGASGSVSSGATGSSQGGKKKMSGQTSPSNKGTGGSPSGSVFSSKTSDALPDPKQSCNADPVQWAIGRPATPQLAERLRREAGADTVRILPPDMAVTEEFRFGRLNIATDRSNVIVRLYCA